VSKGGNLLIVHQTSIGKIPSAIAVLLLLAVPVTAKPKQAVKRGFATVSNAKLFYEMAGQGQPLILIHGGNMDRRMWDQQFAIFAKSYKVIRYDVRGFGKSDKQIKAFAHYQDLYDLMKYLGVKKANVVGLSMGGGIAADFAISHPEMVENLILVCPGINGFTISSDEGAYSIATIEAARDEGYGKATEMWLNSPYMIPAMEHPELRQKLRQLSLDNAHNWLANFVWSRDLKPSTRERLKEIKARTLILVGDRDVPNMMKLIDEAAAKILGARKVVINGVGHLPNMEEPAEFNKIVLGFLANGS
jgi:pimeloyl-ACP methyl ester carboxylesterase